MVALPKVVIVGAGIAGLAAAVSLQRSKLFQVIVLEASGRVGGRIQTVEFENERVELGATWIHGIDGSPVYALAESEGLMNPVQVSGNRSMTWTGKRQTRCSDSTAIDPEMSLWVRQTFEELLNEAQVIGGISSQLSAQTRAAVEGESLGSFLRRGFSHRVKLFMTGKLPQSTASPEVSDWADAETASEPGTSAVAFGTGFSSSAGPSTGALMATGKDQMTSSEASVDLSVQLYSEEDSDLAWMTADSALSQLLAVFEARARLECCVSAVHSLDELALMWFGEYQEFSGPHVTIPGGYSGVPQSMADSLHPGTVLLNRQVSQIHWCCESGEQGSPVKVITADGECHLAQHVIVTVPLGVLKERALGTPAQQLFFPALPEWKQAAIDRLGFGTVNKLFLAFPNARIWGDSCQSLELAWPNDAVTDGGNLPGWAQMLFKFDPINVRSRVVVSWSAGEAAEAMEEVPEEEIMDVCTAAMAQFLEEGARKLLPRPVALLRSQWKSNPFFRGSYSFVKVGSSGEDIDRLAEPLPRLAEGGGAQFQVLFAGEATHRYSYSNTHGAFLSGEREAKRLVGLHQ